jgi:hypothetical protein
MIVLFISGECAAAISEFKEQTPVATLSADRIGC